MSTKLTGYVWDGCAASGMKLSSVAIMARLADFSNDEGVCWPSIETIARQIGAGMSTVRTAIARLEAEGWLTRKARRQGNRIRDLDNYNKALFDALTHAGVWEDDRQVKRMLVEWGPVIPKGKVEITISKYEKPAGAAA
ncbi:RusA family crossover junction endodeoxyribonuclease [Escherichia coli]|nr:RusA family crossover junction endodeoxyribonuclease [Escherichia coli]